MIIPKRLTSLKLHSKETLLTSVPQRQGEAKLQGLCRALPGPETHHPGRFECAPTPLTLVVGNHEC